MNENKNNNNNKECNCNPDQIVFAFNLDTVSTSFIIIISLFPLLACIYVQYSCSLGLPNCFSNQKVHRVPWKRQHTHRHTSRTLILKYVSFRFYAFCCFHFHFDTELSPLSLSLCPSVSIGMAFNSFLFSCCSYRKHNERQSGGLGNFRCVIENE